MSAKQVADRFNIFDHDALEQFHLLHPGVSLFKVDRQVDYSAGIAQRGYGPQGSYSVFPQPYYHVHSGAHPQGGGVVDRH